uniref:Zinc finger protein 271-like n=1 Tax=Cynoglossus semilaevis TaxID=244447 RepID=A0A3P8UJB7_CYNSE
MCEVKEEIDEDVVRHEASLKPFSEPFLLILSPPPAFLPVPGEPTTFWHKWLKAFETYLGALGETELADSSKCLLLQNCLGLEGQRIFSTLIQSGSTYAAAISVLTSFFTSDRSTQTSRLKFHQRAQKPEETVDQFVSALDELLQPCNYEGAKDEVILNQLTLKTKSLRLRERLLLEKETLTLSKAMLISKEVESALTESEQFDFHEVSVDIGDDVYPPVKKKAKRGRPRRGEIRIKAKPQAAKVPAKSSFKDNFYYSNDKLYYSDNEEDDCTSAAEDDETCGVDENSKKASVSRCNKSTDKDLLISVSSLRKDKQLKKERPYCPICVNRFFRDVNKLARHMRSHTKEKPFRCPVCAVTCSQSYHMIRHLRNQHGAGQHVCFTCGKTLGSSAELRSHKKEHVSESVTCLHCQEVFTDTDTYLIHVQSHSTTADTEEVKNQSDHLGDEADQNQTDSVNEDSPESEGVETMDSGAEESQDGDGAKEKKLPPKSKTKAKKCEKQVEEKSAVSHFQVPKTPGPQSHICGDCGKVFGRTYHLKRHILTHHKAANQEKYGCPECQKSFAFQIDLTKHMQRHAKDGICPKCQKTFDDPEELETHMEMHDKPYSCHSCGKRFKVEYALKKHEEGHGNEQYYCSLCKKHFIKLSHYKRHTQVHERRESRCPHCNIVFLQLTALKYHLRTHTVERPFQCTWCMDTFETKEELEQHSLKHRKFRKERPYTCTRCDYAFPTLPELTEHMNTHEGEQPSCCPICGRTFLNKNKLEKHLSIHTGERPHLCSVCGNGFPSAASLKLHVNIHTGEKPFQCSQCSKAFRSSSGLRLHSRQHMEVRPSYECRECGRRYGRMTELKMHQRYHTGDKPYACTCCSKRFISKDKLNVHMRVHTGERPYSCPHCGQTFTQTGDRNRHIGKYHALEPVDS